MGKNKLYLFLIIIFSGLIFSAWKVAANRNFIELMLPQSEELPSIITCQEPGFNFTKIFDSDNVSYVFTTDFNRDGKLDVALASSPNKITFFLGDGNGNLANSKTVFLDSLVQSIIEADFNHDASPDYLVTTESGVSLLLNDGLGNLSINKISNQSASTVASGDFNLDGKADFVSANQKELTLFLGDGIGGFPRTLKTESPINIEWLLVNNFNQDASKDIIVVGENKVATFLGNKSLNLSSPIITNTSINPKYVQTTDFNQDGKLDLVIIDDNFPSFAQILLSIGNGSFIANEAINTTLSPSAKKTNKNLVVGDFNQDGKPDFVLSNAAPSFDPILEPTFARVFLGDGKGNITYGGLLGSGNARDLIATGDFNQDGKLDLVRASNGQSNFEINLSGISAGCITPSFISSQNNLGLSSPNQSVVADFNNDGKLDVISINSETKDISRLFGNELGSLTAQVQIPVGSEPVDIVATDFNQDGSQDLVVANRLSNTISLLMGDGTGDFNITSTISLGAFEPIALKVGDFNSDGWVDISTVTNNNVLVLTNVEGKSLTKSLTLNIKDSINSLEIADINRDANLDIIIGKSNGSDLTIFLGDGKSNFTSKTILSSCGISPKINGVGDFNRDGFQDLLVNCNTGTNKVLLGDPTYQFTSAISLTDGSLSTFGDFNNDSNLDVLIYVGENKFSLLLGDGKGKTKDLTSFTSDFTLSNALINTGDFNSDGKLDFLITDKANNLVSLLLNTCVGSSSRLVEKGNSQTTAVGAQFSTPLEVKVLDVRGRGVSNVVVEFEAPKASLGAGGSFLGGLNKVSVKTNNEGVAVAPTFIANNFAGEHIVTATVINDVGIRLCGVTFNLTNREGVVIDLVPASGSLPDATVGADYSFTIDASGGTPPYSFALTSGSLPTGLSLSPSGMITGVPTNQTTTSFSIQVTDAAMATGMGSYVLSVVASTPCLDIVVSPPSLPDGFVNTPYMQTLTASGGTPPYMFSVISGALPTGLVLNADGNITGTPSTTGAFSFVVQATDSATDCTGSINYSLNIKAEATCPPITLAPPTLPNAFVGVPYMQTITASGGVEPYTFSIVSGQLPSGLSLDSTGVISGTSFFQESATFVIEAQDSSDPPAPKSNPRNPRNSKKAKNISNIKPLAGNGNCTGSQTYTLNVVCEPIVINPPTLPNPMLGADYDQMLTAGTTRTQNGQYLFGIVAGALPAGLALDTDGRISGIAIEGGVFNFTVRASDIPPARSDIEPLADGDGCSGTRDYTFMVACPTITIAPPTLPNTTVGMAYDQLLTASGGSEPSSNPYTFTVVSGALPPGLDLSPDGTIIGSASMAGNFAFVVQATDPTNCSGSQSYSIAVCGPITIAPPTLPNPTPGIPYNQTLTASGGNPPYIFSIATGTLPPGLTLSQNGVISGTPNVQGTFTFTVQALDMFSCAPGMQTYTISVACSTITITPPVLSTGTVGVAYSQMLGATGGTPPYTFSLVASTGSTLPPGLNLNPNGAITGTPTTAGVFLFNVQVVDGAGCTAGRAYAVGITCPTITVTPPALPSATQGLNYNQALGATGGTPPYIFSVSTGALAPGLTISPSGVISGAPAATGNFNFSVQVRDVNSCLGNRNYSLTVGTCPSINFTLDTLLAGNIGTPYSQMLGATGGMSAPYTFLLLGGENGVNFPPGLTLSSNGAITGVPTTAGVFDFDVQVMDSIGCSNRRTYSITILAACPSFVFAPGLLPSATLGTSYSQTITVTGSTLYNFMIMSGNLPPGLTIQSGPSATTTIVGTPLLAGTFNFTLRATKAILLPGENSCSGSQTYTLVVSQGCGTINVSPNTLPDSTVNALYSQTLTASGGTAPYTFSIASGSLPNGLTLSQSGVLSGTPTSGGSFNFIVQAKDANNCSGNKNYSLNINSTPGTLGFSASSFTVTEGGRLTVTITRTSGASGQVAVSYATNNGSAVSGREFAPAQGTVTFADGDTTPKTFTIQTNSNTLVEPNKSFTIQLSNPTGSAKLGTANATVTITEKDVAQPGSLAFTQPNYMIAETGGAATITVVRLNGGNIPISVTYSTSAGLNAVPGTNYIETRGILNFTPGANIQSFTIPVLNDNQTGSNKTVNISLSNPTGGATLSGGFATLSIQEVSNNPAQLKIDLQDIDFGAVNIGSLAKRTITVTNTGGQELNFTPTLSGNGVKILGSPNTRLLASQSTTFDMAFEALPGSLGNLVGILNITSNGGNAAIKIFGKSIDTIAPKMTFDNLNGGDIVNSGSQVKIGFSVIENDALNDSTVSFAAVLADGKVLTGDIARLDGQGREATWNVPLDLESSGVKIFLKSSDRASNITTLASGRFSVRRSSFSAPVLETLISFTPPPTSDTPSAPSGLTVDAKESDIGRVNIAPEPALSVQINFQPPIPGMVAPPRNVTVRASELTDKNIAQIAKVKLGIMPKAEGDLVIAGYNVYRVPQNQDGSMPSADEIVKEENLVTTLPPNATGFNDKVSTSGANNYTYSVSTFFGNGQMSGGSQPMGTNLPVIINPIFKEGTVFLDSPNSFIKPGASLIINDKETYTLQFDTTGSRFTVPKKQASNGSSLVVKRLIGKTTIVQMVVKNPDGATSVTIKFGRKGIVKTIANIAKEKLNPSIEPKAALAVAGYNIYRVAQPLDGKVLSPSEIIKPENLVGSIPANMNTFLDKVSTSSSSSGNFTYSVSTFFGNGQMSSGSQPASTDLPIVKNPKFDDKNFFVDSPGAFIKPGATLIINDREMYILEFDDTGSRFTPRRKTGSPSNQTIDQFIKKGDTVRLTIKNPDGKLSVGVMFTRGK